MAHRNIPEQTREEVIPTNPSGFARITRSTGGKLVETETNNKDDIGQIIWTFGLVIVGGFATLMLTFWWRGVIVGTEAKAIVIGLFSAALLLIVLGIALDLFLRSRKTAK